MLVANGLEGAIRVNVPVLLPRTQLLEPFGFVGLGWSHYSVTNTNVTTADMARDDDIMSLPIGGGLEYAIGRFMADARFTYRSTYYNDLMRTGGNLNNWGVSGQVGFSFCRQGRRRAGPGGWRQAEGSPRVRRQSVHMLGGGERWSVEVL